MPGTVPNAPGDRLLPFRVETNGIIHLRVAFLGDPNTGGGAPSSSLVNTRVTLVAAREIGVGGVTLNDSAVFPPSSVWLPVGNDELIKTVEGGYATFTGGSLEGTFGNVLPLTLTVTAPPPDDAINSTWFLVIKSDIQLWVTFAVSEAASDTAEDVKIPWIHVPSTSATINFSGSFTPNSTTTPAGTVPGVCNFGTGDLDITATTTTESDMSDSVHVSSVTIPAASSGSIPLGYTAADGLSGLIVDIESDDPTPSTELIGDYHNARITVSAETTFVGIADTVLVLDASGSMLLRPDGWGYGNSTGMTPADRRRWDNLVTAAGHMAFGYNEFCRDEAGGVGRLGVAVFPDVLNKTPGWHARAGTLVPSANVSAALPGQINAQLDLAGGAIEGAGLTPMGEGIGVAMGTTAASTGMFEPISDAHRRWMVLMTDGAHNAGTVHPNQFYLPDTVGDFIPKQVRLYAIGYTTAAGGTAVSLLQDLAANAFESPGTNESQYVAAAVSDGFEKDLTDTFLDALAVSLGLTPTFDPAGTLTSTSPVAVHQFHVSPYDSGVGIFVDWNSPDADRVHLTLISPRCERFEQGELMEHKDFRFRALSSSSHAYISRAALAGDEKGSRYGNWRLELRLRAPIVIERKAEQTERYKFSIINRSGLRLVGGATEKRFGTGQPIDLVMRLQAHGAPVSGARVVATVNGPTADYGSILAGASVDPKLLERVRGEQKSADQLGPWAIKGQAIALEHGPIQVSRSRRELVFHEGPPGEYRAKLLHADFGGVYTAHVVATGVVDGVPYRRERAVVANVEAFPDPSQTIVTYTLDASGQLTVHVRPRDVNGNPVIFEPSVSPLLEIKTRDAKPITDVVNQLDGSYTRSFELTGGRPEVTVIYDGEVIVPAQPLPDPKSLKWMERVVAYEPDCGDDPKKALGPVKGPEDPFVQVVAGGAIELGAAERHFFATHVAVFVHRKSTQPYRVFARFEGKRVLELGMGHGPTEVFEVPDRYGPIRSIIVQNTRRKGEAVLVQGVGYILRKVKPIKKPGFSKLISKLGF
ncbi:MAG TPA: hypothetical protein VM869_14105 [Enhygromyxa sp.]|nr:hypothetical protein [Enhygromyxa sp.]